MVRLFLETDFVGERHTQQVEKLSALDRIGGYPELLRTTDYC